MAFCDNAKAVVFNTKSFYHSVKYKSNVYNEWYIENGTQKQLM